MTPAPTPDGRTNEVHSRITARPCPPHFHIKSTRSLRSSSSSCTCHLPFVVLRLRRVFSRRTSRRWGSSRRIGQGNKSGDRMCSCQSHYRIINSCSEEHASHNLTCSVPTHHPRILCHEPLTSSLSTSQEQSKDLYYILCK